MKINVLTIYCALGVAVLAASTHEVSTNKHFEGDDFQIDVDQEVGNVTIAEEFAAQAERSPADGLEMGEESGLIDGGLAKGNALEDKLGLIEGRGEGTIVMSGYRRRAGSKRSKKKGRRGRKRRRKRPRKAPVPSCTHDEEAVVQISVLGNDFLSASSPKERRLKSGSGSGGKRSGKKSLGKKGGKKKPRKKTKRPRRKKKLAFPPNLAVWPAPGVYCCDVGEFCQACLAIDSIVLLSCVSDLGSLEQGDCHYDEINNKLCFQQNDDDTDEPGRTYSVEYEATYNNGRTAANTRQVFFPINEKFILAKNFIQVESTASTAAQSLSPTQSLSPSSPPSANLSESPSLQPSSSSPSAPPSDSPSTSPSHTPSSFPTASPSGFPSTSPSSYPSSLPSESPSVTGATASPNVSPSASPSVSPSSFPSTSASASPSISPSISPSASASASPSLSPSTSPSAVPSSSPSSSPSVLPSALPSVNPSLNPSASPSGSPSATPSIIPSSSPSASHSASPSFSPSISSSALPTTSSPSSSPSVRPSAEPSTLPSASPSLSPSSAYVTPGAPSSSPSISPSSSPSFLPSDSPSQASATASPTVSPSASPSVRPSSFPSTSPSVTPSISPSSSPSASPSLSPSLSPSSTPSDPPSASPSLSPSTSPSGLPSDPPSPTPSVSPSAAPSALPSGNPSFSPSASPSGNPSSRPSVTPSSSPSAPPSSSPSLSPSLFPSASPSLSPSVSPSSSPSTSPSSSPSSMPSCSPSDAPSDGPSVIPSVSPSASPSAIPSDMPSSAPSIIGSICENFAVHARSALTFAATNTIKGGDLSVKPVTSGTCTLIDGIKASSADSLAFDTAAAASWSEAVDPRDNTQTIPTEMGGNTFTPGTWRTETFITVAANLIVTLDGLGDPDSEFLFQSNSYMWVGATTKFVLINEARWENVLWACRTYFMGGATVDFNGSIIAGTYVTWGASLTMHGCVVSLSAITFGATTEVSVAPPTESTSPSNIPSASPTATPSHSPTFYPTVSPTAAAMTTGCDADPSSSRRTSVLDFNSSQTTSVDEILETEEECPKDIQLIAINGTTEYDADIPPIHILSQDQDTVTFQVLQNMFAGSVSYMFTQFQTVPNGDSRCLANAAVTQSDDTLIFTARCMHRTPLSIVDLWFVDAALDADYDTAKLSDRCPKDAVQYTVMPTVQYTFQLHCVPQCSVPTY